MKYNYNYRNENGEYAPKVLLVDGCEVHGASAAMYAAQGYYPYTPPEPTAEETAEQQRLARIDELRTLLAESDYKAIKYAEGWITAEDYAEVKAQRQAWRDEINELETQ
jgi:ABC-type Fe3+ transport system substrate-binding protein